MFPAEVGLRSSLPLFDLEQTTGDKNWQSAEMDTESQSLKIKLFKNCLISFSALTQLDGRDNCRWTLISNRCITPLEPIAI